jgi:hypothetical protein
VDARDHGAQVAAPVRRLRDEARRAEGAPLLQCPKHGALARDAFGPGSRHGKHGEPMAGEEGEPPVIAQLELKLVQSAGSAERFERSLGALRRQEIRVSS